MTSTVTLTHWGAYRPVARDGRLLAMEPLAHDPSPSPIGQSIPGTLNDPARITQPMVREGFLAEAPLLEAGVELKPSSR